MAYTDRRRPPASGGQSPQLNNQGHVVWHGHHQGDREIFIHDDSGEAIRLTDNEAPDHAPQINNRGQMVWHGHDGNDHEIFLLNPQGEPIQLTDNATDDQLPQINHHGWVVWEGFDGNDREIFLYRGYGQPIQITDNDYDDFGPRINRRGDVVWTGKADNDLEIFLYRGYGRVMQVTDNDFDDYNPQINTNGWLVWQGDDGDDFEIFQYQGRRHANCRRHKNCGRVVQLTDNESDDRSPQINDRGWIVWESGVGNNKEILLRKSKKKTIQLTDNDVEDYGPRINNKGWVVWTGFDGNDHEIFMHNKHEGVMQLSDNDYDDYEPQINGQGQVAWGAQNGFSNEIWRASSPGVLLWSSDPNAIMYSIVHSRNEVFDIQLPAYIEPAPLIIELKGADGGRRYYKDCCLINDHYANGGEGATVAANFIVGILPNQIPPGSILRFILGEPGQSANSGAAVGSGGGGGSGVLFLPPGGSDGHWKHLLVAGAGGGAFADVLADHKAGLGGRSVDCTSGDGGGHDIDVRTSGGAGWLQDSDTAASGSIGNSSSAKAGWSISAPTGGDGGAGESAGGWGYGGGGFTDPYVGLATSGGGGGGACGGDAGYAIYPGNGGYSWINAAYVSGEIQRQDGGSVHSPQGGFATVQLQQFNPKKVFVSSATYTADFGGIAGANDICDQLALDAGIHGLYRYRAWLGDDSSGPLDNSNLNNQFFLVNGDFVGTKENLINGNLLVPISITENGDAVSGNVWTGSDAGGHWDDPTGRLYTCENWTDRNWNGVVGNSTLTDKRWSYEKSAPCGLGQRLYCFEQ